MAAFFTSFAGGFLVAPLCGEPVLDVVGDPLRLLIFTALWYLMYYTPGDVIYTASKMLPVKTFLYVMKGLYYPKKIVAGIVCCYPSATKLVVRPSQAATNMNHWIWL